MTVEEILDSMKKDAKVDIYEDVYGLEYWAEEVYNLRIQNAILKLELEECKKLDSTNSWALNPDRMGGQFTDEELNQSSDGWN